MTQKPISKNPRYNLSLVVQETGLKPDTLRAWEKRYQMPQPDRTEGGHRLYSDYDLQSIKWLQKRLEEGMRISQAVNYWQDLVAAGTNPLGKTASSIAGKTLLGSAISGHTLSALQGKWLEFSLKFDEVRADQVLSQAFAQYPLEVVCTDLIQASLSQIGRLWYEGEATVQQEHFTSELASKKLQALIASAPLPLQDQKILLACPPGEFHTISLLMINLLLRYRGWDVLYLGGNVPIDRMTEIILKTRPALALFSASRLPTAASLVETVQLLREHQVPSAYGGWIFNQDQMLTDCVPAWYLGEDLPGSVIMIEKLLDNPEFSSNLSPAALSTELTDYQDNLNLLEYKLLENLDGNRGKYLHADDLQDINRHLSEDIMAALRLGDITLLGPELEWIKGLLNNRKLPEGLFPMYLNAYADAARLVLGDSGRLILPWLESFLANFHLKEE